MSVYSIQENSNLSCLKCALSEVEIPDDKSLFSLIRPQDPARASLKDRAIDLDNLQELLKEATDHATRDRLIALIGGACLTGLLTGLVLGIVFSHPFIALGCGMPLFFALCIGNDEYGGAPGYIFDLLDRKRDLQSRFEYFEQKFLSDLKLLGTDLQTNTVEYLRILDLNIQKQEDRLRKLLPLEKEEPVIAKLIHDIRAEIERVSSLKEELSQKGPQLIARLVQAQILKA
jgi:hypothetical protein